MKGLYRTKIEIWTEYNPANPPVELVDLARDATDGEAYCNRQATEYIADPGQAGLQTEFFNGYEEAN